MGRKGASVGYRVLGALSGAVWVFLSWPTLRAELRAGATARALAVGLVGALLGALLPSVARLVQALFTRGPAWLFLTLASVASSAVTAAVYQKVLLGYPMARDSCVYWLQARALAHGSFGVPMQHPRQFFGVHFLFEGADGRMHGVFGPGYPLFLVPFALLGASWLVGPVTATLLVYAQHRLGRALTQDEGAARLAVLLALPSFARAVETADLLSHAFVAALAALALALAWELRETPTRCRALALGGGVGWALAARALDGLGLCLAVGALLLGALLRRRIAPTVALLAALSAAPFLGLVALQQKVATGSYRTPMAVAYARRADHPPGCLRLGFGRGIGCVVEHTDEVHAFGPDGYTPDDALRVVRERTGVLGRDLLGLSALGALAAASAALAPGASTMFLALWCIGFTLLYGLFYYGNADTYGARHVFPLAPALYLLLARALRALPRREDGRRGDRAHTEGALALGLAGACVAAAVPLWRAGVAASLAWQGHRVEAAPTLAREGVDEGVIVVRDLHTYLRGMDPWQARSWMVLDDGAGVLDLRREHPAQALHYFQPPNILVRARAPQPGPGLHLELERAWPTFVRPQGLGTAIVHSPSCCAVPSSGEHVLFLFAVEGAGATLRVPFDAPDGGTYVFHLEGLVAPDYGDWEVSLDGAPLPRWEGYGPAVERRRGPDSAPRRFLPGAHELLFRCVGKDPRSRGYLVAFDTLEGARVGALP